MRQTLTKALALMQEALGLIDGCDDPFTAGPHLDLAIARVEQGLRAKAGNDNPDEAAERAID
jgi:hypothetical protein